MKKFLTVTLLFFSIFGFSNAGNNTLDDKKQSIYDFMKFHTKY